MAAVSAPVPDVVATHMSSFTDEEKRAVKILLDNDQTHVFNDWPALGQDDAKKTQLLNQVLALERQYPGGISKYVSNARGLLEDSRKGVNPYDGWIPSVPEGIRLTQGTKDFTELESIGAKAMEGAAFVLVAGGLGERLGYNGIKLALPSETTTGTCFLEYYAQFILALQSRASASAGKRVVLPLVIMTSDDTHSRTLQLLAAHQNFGLEPNQIQILKQEMVPALVDNAAHIALNSSNPYEIVVKPHGHGDVHLLLANSGVAKQWAEEGRKWIIFFQDTNGLVFRALVAALGVSVHNNFEVNSLTVPRKPGEAVGGICRLTHRDGKNITINVEYNQLDPLLRSTTSPQGDVADASGFSPYPGNINVLIFAAPQYAQVLSKTHGHIPEFVNPKYADATKTKFTSPTRLESMMQDYPKCLEPTSRVGFTQFERWTSFSAVKNNLKDAADKFKKTGVAESAASGESDLYYYNRRLLGLHPERKVHINVEGSQQVFAGVPVQVGARIVFHPSFATTTSEILGRIKGDVRISDRSTLVVKGDVVIENLELDGALIINAEDGAQVVIRNLKVQNDGWNFVPVNVEDKSVDESLRIRGYTIERKASQNLRYSTKHVVDESSSL